MKRILFVCSANRFRSVIAAEYFRHLLTRRGGAENLEVSSAGTWAEEGLSPVGEAVGYALAHGFDVQSVHSREISREIIHNSDLVIVMTADQLESLGCEFEESKPKLVLFSEICSGQVYDIPDPITCVDESPEIVGGEICALIESGFQQILDRVSSS